MIASHPNPVGNPKNRGCGCFGNFQNAHLLRCLVLVVLGCAFLVSGCATQLSTRASRVRLLAAEQVKPVENKCIFLAFVQGSSSWFLIERIAYNNALNEMLDNAAELGATHVFVGKGDVRNLLGEAYYCAYCLAPNGQRDRGYCRNPDGASNYGLTKFECLDQGFDWIEAATDRISCEAKGGRWLPNPSALREEKEDEVYETAPMEGPPL